jgi:hypothetical protein
MVPARFLIHSKMAKDLSFNQIKEEANRAATDCLEQTLNTRTYNPTEVQAWTGQICEDVVNRLKEINTNFKYTVTCIIM